MNGIQTETRPINPLNLSKKRCSISEEKNSGHGQRQKKMTSEIKKTKTAEGDEVFLYDSHAYLIRDIEPTKYWPNCKFETLLLYDHRGFENKILHAKDFTKTNDRFETKEDALNEILDILNSKIQIKSFGRRSLYFNDEKIKRTPWGMSDSAEFHADGIIFYGTPSHGGFKLDRTRQNQMPYAFRSKGGWYEEDSDWAKVAFVFNKYFSDREVRLAENTLINWYPDEYMEVTGKSLTADQSTVLAEREFKEANKDSWVVIAALVNKEDKEIVDCVATLGGIRSTFTTDVEEKYFKVPANEYDKRSRHGFVIDTTRHEEVFPNSQNLKM